MTRNRIIYLVAICVVVALGLGSRRYAATLPTVIGEDAGDALWALVVFLGIGFLAPAMSTFKVAVIAALFSYCIEFSQLYQAPWINHLRQTVLGGLILGFGFRWGDLLRYTVGIGFGAATEISWTRLTSKR